MAGNKNLLNSSFKEVLLESLYRNTGWNARANQALINVAYQVSPANTAWTITPTQAGLQQGLVDTARGLFTKSDYSPYFPQDICYSGLWPATYASLSEFFMTSYGLLMEKGFWRVVKDGQSILLDDTAWINFDLSATRSFRLEASAAHPAFLAGSGFPVLVTGEDNAISPLQAQLNGPVEGAVGQNLRKEIFILGGRGPYVVSLKSGQLPVPIRTGPFRLEGIPTRDGVFSFVLTVMDLDGRTVDLEQSVDVALLPFQVSGSFAEGQVDTAYQGQLTFTGGVAPYQVTQIQDAPVGLVVGNDGSLSGYPDVGNHQPKITFQDTRGRSAVYGGSTDLLVPARNTRLCAEATLGSLREWVDFEAGLRPAGQVPTSYYSTTPWLVFTGSAVDAVGPKAGAALLQDGYFRQSAVAGNYNGTVAVGIWLRADAYSTGACIASCRDGNGGWEVSVGDNDIRQMRFTVNVDGIFRSIAANDPTPPVDEEWSFFVFQFAHNTVAVFRNGRLIASEYEPGRYVGSALPITIGRRAADLVGWQWSGAIAKLFVTDKRLWVDQQQQLYNAGKGMSIRDLKTAANVSTSTQVRVSGSLSNGRLGVTYREELQITGGTNRQTTRRLQGSLPPGLSVSTSDPDRLVITGVPTLGGLFTSKWVIGSLEDAVGFDININVVSA